MRGLLKAYSGMPIDAEIDSRYEKRPERLGMTIAYGEIPDEASPLEGEVIRLRSRWLVYGEKTTFLTCELVRSKVGDRVLKIRRLLLPMPKPFHLTLGWIEGGCPAQAGDECATFWRGIVGPKLPSVLCKKTIEATIEFQNFEAQ